MLRVLKGILNERMQVNVWDSNDGDLGSCTFRVLQVLTGLIYVMSLFEHINSKAGR